jgi:uncharacterized cupin superfamily protein
LSGMIDMELENDEVIHLKPGDVVVQRGTVHTWSIGAQSRRSPHSS